MNIGDNISKLRKEKNLTQEELAKLINVSAKTISSYETNRSIPNIEILILLSDKLEVSIDEIIGLNKENVLELNSIYEKKNTKDSIIKIFLIGIIAIIPILFFWYYSDMCFRAALARLSTHSDTDTILLYKDFLSVFSFSIVEYIIYLIIMLVNYLLYKKKWNIPLFVINGLMMILLIISIV